MWTHLYLQALVNSQLILDGWCITTFLEEGEVYAWGHGGQGQLGQPSIQNQRVPVEIKALSDDKIVFIACGGSSSAAVSGMYQIIYLL